MTSVQRSLVDSTHVSCCVRYNHPLIRKFRLLADISQGADLSVSVFNFRRSVPGGDAMLNVYLQAIPPAANMLTARGCRGIFSRKHSLV